MIREAGLEDIPDLVRMGARFFEQNEWPEGTAYNSEHIAGVFERLIEDEGSVIYVCDRGAIGGITFQHYITGQIVAQELFWWVEPEARGDGLRLLTALEDWASARAESLSMIALEHFKPVGPLYERRGYMRMETMYMKAF